MLAGRDVLAKSPTGSGKTLAFGVPIADRIAADSRRPAALILAPTRELATQIVDDIRSIARARALRVTAVYGGVGLHAQSKAAAGSHILVATPGRLEDLLARRAFDLRAIQILVLDEADRMLDMGFRPAVDRIVAACPADRQTLFFSATLDGEAGQVARRYTRDAVVHEQGPTARRASVDVEHRFVEIAHEHRLEALVAELRRDRELTLVFVRTKHGADRLVKRLRRHGVEAVAMHGNKSQRQRERALARFESGAIDTLVATDVAARGIDVERDLARDQLRPAGRPRHLRPPDRPHRARRRQGHRDHAGRRRPAPRRQPARGPARARLRRDRRRPPRRPASPLRRPSRCARESAGTTATGSSPDGRSAVSKLGSSARWTWPNVSRNSSAGSRNPIRWVR